ncbi:hypothetical protein K6L59_02700, partial [Candidatus Phytoplasma sp. Tabriz.2]|nr:hypothetical protein [Candidatus Phytoplasma australiense]
MKKQNLLADLDTFINLIFLFFIFFLFQLIKTSSSIYLFSIKETTFFLFLKFRASRYTCKFI